MFVQASPPVDAVDSREAIRSAAHDESGRWLRHVKIEQAKGTLTALFGFDADESFAVLVTQSQTRNVAIHVLAVRFLAALRKPYENSESTQRAHRSLDRLFDG